MLLIQRIQMTVNSGLHFNRISGREKGEMRASLEGHIGCWGIRCQRSGLGSWSVCSVWSPELWAGIWCLDCSAGCAQLAEGERSCLGRKYTFNGHRLSHLCDCVHFCSDSIYFSSRVSPIIMFQKAFHTLWVTDVPCALHSSLVFLPGGD